MNMKIPLSNHDGKMFRLEEGENPAESSPESRLQRMAKHFKLFKWFIGINVLLLLIFCGYALWNLYQLESSMRSREEALSLNRYFDRYQANLNQRDDASTGNVNIADLNDTVIASDFSEWRNSILRSLEDLEADKAEKSDVSYNLTFLLNTITSIVKNLVDSNEVEARKTENSGNVTSLLKNKLIVANLTDFEVQILKEFTRLKMADNVRSRIPRTLKGGPDESGCNFKIDVTTNENVRVVVKPTKKGEGTLNIKNTLKDLSKNTTDTRECSFNIIYE